MRALVGVVLSAVGCGLLCAAGTNDLGSAEVLVRTACAARLGRAGDREAVPALIGALRDSDKGVRREAAKALGFLKDGRASGALAAALKDGDANVRFLAAYALGEIKDPSVAAALLGALRDAEWTVRNQAAWALRELHDPSIAPAAVAALKDEGADVAAVSWLVNQIGGVSAVAPLAALAKSPEAGARLRAVQALAALRDPAAMAALAGALSDTDAGVRRCAVDALAVIGGRPAAEALRRFASGEQNAELRAAAEKAALAIVPPAKLGAHWPFDDRNTSSARDATGHGNDGQIANGTPVEGRVGAGLDFGGRGGVELGKPKTLPTADQPITVMAWVKARGSNGVVVARGGAFSGYSLYIKGGVPKFGMRRAAQDQAAAIAAGPASVIGAWRHLAGVIAKDRIELYVDGTLAASAKTAGCLPGNCGQGMEIGFDAGNSAVEIVDHFDGIIDEVKVFQEALGAEAIAAEANGGGRK